MGGQACVLYGAAEFSRDADLAVLADDENLVRLNKALDDLQAQRIAVPPFERKFLEMGLAVHFRCKLPEAMNIRIDVMSRMRGVDEFGSLWRRRTTFKVQGEEIELLSLPDLAQAKKTQRDKDWPMLSRLVEASYFGNRDHPTEQQVDFWLRELRTPSLLAEAAERFPKECEMAAPERPLLALIGSAGSDVLEKAIKEEELREREADRRYWQPLRKELERLRSEARNQ